MTRKTKAPVCPARGAGGSCIAHLSERTRLSLRGAIVDAVAKQWVLVANSSPIDMMPRHFPWHLAQLRVHAFDVLSDFLRHRTARARSPQGPRSLRTPRASASTCLETPERQPTRANRLLTHSGPFFIQEFKGRSTKRTVARPVTHYARLQLLRRNRGQRPIAGSVDGSRHVIPGAHDCLPARLELAGH